MTPTKQIIISLIITIISMSCASDSEIRALYSNRPCPQKIEMNTQVTCVQSEACKMTEDDITFENDILEKRIVFEKAIPANCPYTRSLADLKWEPAVYFDYNRHDLTQTAINRLNNNLKILSRFPDACIAIRGFTDNRGNHAYNQRLANRRTITTLNYLEMKGIDKTRIVISPVGETAPLLPNKSEENMAINRRVELLLLDMSGQPVPYVILTKAMRTLIDQDIDQSSFCKIWKNKVLWYPGIFFHSNRNHLNSQGELDKLESNIQVLKSHPEFMISIREFSSNNVHTRHALERIQYVEEELYQNHIDNKRIQLVPPEDTLIFQGHLTFTHKLPCVEMLLLDRQARPFSVIVNIKKGEKVK